MIDKNHLSTKKPRLARNHQGMEQTIWELFDDTLSCFGSQRKVRGTMTFYVSTDIWYQNLKPVQFAVFMALDTGKRQDGTLSFSQRQIAKMCKISMRSLQKTLLELETRNLIQIEKNQENPENNIIRVNKSKLWRLV